MQYPLVARNNVLSFYVTKQINLRFAKKKKEKSEKQNKLYNPHEFK